MGSVTVVQEQDRAASGAGPGRRLVGGTPRQLWLLTVGLGVLALLFGLVFALALGSDSSSFASLQSRTSEVSATSDLYYELNDMDAQAANALLVGFHPADPSMVPPSVDAAASMSAYEKDRSAADSDLTHIARNPQLTGAAGKLIDSLGTYEALIGQAIYADQNTMKQLPAEPPAAALGSYTEASSLLHTTLLAQALQIADADSSAVDASYSGEHSSADLYGYVIVALALLLGVALYAGNHYHARRFRRRVSWLAGGIAVCLALGFLGLSTQLGAADDLHYAKKEAYDSINALTRARAVSDDANADESRWLLEGRTAALQTSFFQKIGNVAGVPGVSGTSAGGDPQPYYSGLSAAVAALRLDTASDSVSGVTVSGYLGTELDNITFSGEAQAAYDTTRAFDTYVQDDAVIRSDAKRGDLAASVAFDIGTRPGQSNYAFNQYMSKLESVVQINDNAFASGIAAGKSETGATTWMVLIIGELLVLLFIARAGAVRLREYH
ncbi:hypothetical protein KDK95_06855 [Actinospica sp. MGRD01-02]|uniref:Uncharacterized protein n=1 Tax=Actinospica acidithermotolerans TaxID=2828514 RepID=A0A941IGD6_9ACTN|nr:hypothetical protein [Actinospica acidithermotolerans]MBR7826019.1 hypothetical protein [Actinospica acidithermotolerans]